MGIFCFSVIMKAVVLVLTISPLVWGHGGMLWPSTWQDGQHQDLESINSDVMGSNPPVVDPISGKSLGRNTDFLTDETDLVAEERRPEREGELLPRAPLFHLRLSSVLGTATSLTDQLTDTSTPTLTS